jgi:mRNA interferase MazF
MSPKTYNQKVGLTLVCLMSSRIKRYPFEVPIPASLDVGGVDLGSAQEPGLAGQKSQAEFPCIRFTDPAGDFKNSAFAGS